MLSPRMGEPRAKSTVADGPGAGPALVRFEGAVKQFEVVRALDGVSFEMNGGEVHGLIGENGAGKSTLMKALAGVHRLSGGRMELRGERYEPGSARAALEMGVVMIHQELNLVDELTVAENIYLGREPRRAGLIDRGAMNAAAREQVRALGLGVDPTARVGDLSIAACQLVEIAKALSRKARVLIMDEPTAVLTPGETRALFDLVRTLRDSGVLVVLISHRLDEILGVCDRVTVMRDGRYVTTVTPAETSAAGLAELMVGRTLSEQYPRAAEPGGGGGTPALEVVNLTLPGVLSDVSVTVKKGEIVGLAGLIGAGRTELGEALVGLRRGWTGTVRVEGRALKAGSVREATAAGLVYLSEDRKGRGLHVDLPIMDNVTMVSLGRYCRPLVSARGQREATARHQKSLAIKLGRAGDPASSLSGGNQQKVAIAKWLEMGPRVLIVDEPTRGVDVGAKREIYLTIRQLVEAGMSCLMISSDMPELLGMCHRAYVMRGGKIAGELRGAEMSEERVMALAAGVEGAKGKNGAAA
jgi:ribose transport system ATP-binding protein